MARYKAYSYQQTKFIPISYEKQIIPGTFEHTLDYLIENKVDISVFSQKYQNDDTGAPAYNPAILLKIILYAYSKGILSSREISRCCEENVVFMALSADTHPHFTTIANFISSMHQEVIEIFRHVLMVCSEMKLIEKSMFAIDGCKLSSNAAKEWSGTKKDLLKKKEKLLDNLGYIIEKHIEKDGQAPDNKMVEEKFEERIIKAEAKIDRISKWLKKNEDKNGTRGRLKQSNITDNESAKMKSSHGVIQGYNGIAVVDSKHQISLYAEAHGEGSDASLIKPTVKGLKENLESINESGEMDSDVFKGVKILADTGFSSEINLEFLANEKIDAYIPDNNYRKRDPRYDTAMRHRGKNAVAKFTLADFTYDPHKNHYICPEGKRLGPTHTRNKIFGYGIAKVYRAKPSDCELCPVRSKCLKKQSGKARSLCVPIEGKTGFLTHIQAMKDKIDTEEGREIYSKRMGIVEPVFGNITSCKKMNRFTLRTKQKVNVQWMLYNIVHNIEKIWRYGTPIPV